MVGVTVLMIMPVAVNVVSMVYDEWALFPIE